MLIQKASLHDIDAIHHLGTHVAEFSVSDQTVTFWPKHILQDAIMSKDVVVIVAKEEHALIGFAIAAYNDALKKATIENIYVLPGRRGEGVGKKLISKMLLALAKKGCKYVATAVPYASDDAVHLYEAVGFVKGEKFIWLDKILSEDFLKQS